MSGSDDFTRGYARGHKVGFEHGFVAAKATFEKLAFELDRQISHFPDAKIEEVFQDWFGEKSETQSEEVTE